MWTVIRESTRRGDLPRPTLPPKGLMNDDTPVGRLPTLAEVRRAKGMSVRRLSLSTVPMVRATAISAIESGASRAFPGHRETIANALGMTPEMIDWDIPRKR